MNTMNNNPFKGQRIEFHILQPFPVTCLNRDDVGAPKTAMVGGSTRARVSSQCWKRQVRLEMHELGVRLGVRTKHILPLIENACKENGASEEQAKACCEKFDQLFIKTKEEKKAKKGKKTEEIEEVESTETGQEKADTLLFLSLNETAIIAEVFAKVFGQKDLISDAMKTAKDESKQTSEFARQLDEELKKTDAYDIALFGRMVAHAAKWNINAAASFAHAISTHTVSNEVEFFTALDDRPEKPGSAHMGSLEFNSATYYRYVSLDLGQLRDNLGGAEIADAVEAFTRALFVAVPSARQTTQSGASPWEFAKIYIRKGQRLQVPFETAVKAEKGGFLQPSIDALSDYLAKKEKLAGSMFGKEKEFDFGKNETFSIDTLVGEIRNFIEAKS